MAFTYNLTVLGLSSASETPEHALPAFILTGDLAGLTEQQIQDASTRGDRESVIAAAATGPDKKKTR